MAKWYVYILRCADQSLYTGVTTDIEARVATHNAGKGAKYTRGRLPVKPVYREALADRSAALKREHAIKRMPVAAKRQLISLSSEVDHVRVTYRSTKSLPRNQVLKLYRSVQWSAAAKPARLMRALEGSDSVISAWVGDSLVGLGNTLCDQGLVVYYSHLLVLPEYQRHGIGREILQRLMQRYRHFHQHMLVSDPRALGFYRACGFVRAGRTISMWIFKGSEHQ